MIVNFIDNIIDKYHFEGYNLLYVSYNFSLKDLVNLKILIERNDLATDNIWLNPIHKKRLIALLKEHDGLNYISENRFQLWGANVIFKNEIKENIIYAADIYSKRHFRDCIEDFYCRAFAKAIILTKDESMIKDIIE